MSGVKRFVHRRLSPAEFTLKLRESGLTLSDFLFLSGRNRQQITEFQAGRSVSYTPTMGDAMILELAMLDDANIDDMFDIANAYVEGTNQKRNG